MIDRDMLRRHCLSQKGAVEDYPFGPQNAVYKVMGKMFALIPLESHVPVQVVVKCDPDLALLLRQTYQGVQGAWHFNKRHWNDIYANQDVPEDEVFEMIDHSYALVVKGLTRAQKAALNAL